MEKSLQDTFAPHNACFGCGPSNDKGLGLKSFPEGDIVVAEFQPQDHHQAFPGMLNGGIIGTLLDCHSNWTSAWTLMNQAGEVTPPCTVTAKYGIKLLRPTPLEAKVRLSAKPVEVHKDRVLIEATLTANDKICATCEGLFVAVTEGHPAYHQW